MCIRDSNKTLAAQLYGEMKELFPENAVEYFVSYYDYYQPEAYVPRSDTYIEKDASINEQIDRMRHSATRSLLMRQDVIIVASVSCIYGIGSLETYSEMTLVIEVNKELNQQSIISRLVELQYKRNDINFKRGTFRKRGDILEIFPSHLEDTAWKISFFGDDVELIFEFDPLTGEKIRELNRIKIFANSHYVTPKPTLRNAIKEIGYDFGDFNHENVKIMIQLHEQSPDIARGVDAVGDNSEGAGDQGIMFGYACKETKELMPATLSFSHKILKDLAYKRKNNIITGILPDSKSQLTLFYENDKPKYIDSIVVSSQHKEETTQEYLHEEINRLCKKILPDEWYTDDTKLLVNPTGKFVIGGPVGDTGLTGRKIIVDTYGGASPHGGGAFSGKDPTKVDRSAAYAARYLSKNIVHAGISERCTIQLSYAIGVSEPLSIFVDLHDKNNVDTNRVCLLYTSPSPRDRTRSRMPSSA